MEKNPNGKSRLRGILVKRLKTGLVTLFALFCLALGGCDNDDPETPLENTLLTCLDGLDNDMDGQTDCADTGCQSFPKCWAESDDDDDGGLNDEDAGTDDEDDVKWWILVHPSSAPDGPGIFLYNETNDEVERHLEIPSELGSPHALDFDGQSLWLGGHGPKKIYELDPQNGDVISEISCDNTEGIAIWGDNIWYSQYWFNSIIYMTKEGEILKEIEMSVNIMNDLAVDDEWLYYAINDDIDRIVRVDPESGHEEDLITYAVDSLTLYTLAVEGNALVLVDGKNLRRFNRTTGELMSETPISVRGWITAIAPYQTPTLTL